MRRTHSIDAVPMENTEERTARLDSNLKAFEAVVRRYHNSIDTALSIDYSA